jgi:CDP-glycerol glycerophosphotransferase (TagB/SpsB family)
LNSLISDQFNIDEKKLFSLGFPRNDVLMASKRDFSSLFGKRYDKIIVWYPTFRQHKSGGGTASRNALPIIHDQVKAKKLNDFAMKLNTLIVVKPHFAQDISYIQDLNLNNIVFINDEFFFQNHISSYEFVGSCDALITDYSSVLFDYLLYGKAAVLFAPDLEKYRENRGFYLDYETVPFPQTQSLEELISAVETSDEWQKAHGKESNRFREVYVGACDGSSTQRILRQIGLFR